MSAISKKYILNVINNLSTIDYGHLDKRLEISYICRLRLMGLKKDYTRIFIRAGYVAGSLHKEGNLRVRTVMLLKNKGVTGASAPSTAKA